MKRETIEQFMDEAGVTPGEWYLQGGWWIGSDKDNKCLASCSTKHKGTGLCLTASRDMLMELIELHIWQGNLPSRWCDDAVYHGTELQIEKALPAYTWPEIKARLEQIEGGER